VNARLRTILRFYQWAVSERLVARFPFDDLSVPLRYLGGMLAHTDGSARMRVSSAGRRQLELPAAGLVDARQSALLMRESAAPIRLLTLEQCKVCLNALTNITHRLLFRLGVQTGLRSEELRTFPMKYVFDPMRRSDLTGKAAYRMRLSPAEMALKGSKARTIDVPVPLLAELWRYVDAWFAATLHVWAGRL
jgi:integrase/recombinase XerD